MKWYVQVLYLDTRDTKRQVLIEKDTQEAAELAAVEMIHHGILRVDQVDYIEFIPLRRINMIRVVSEASEYAAGRKV